MESSSLDKSRGIIPGSLSEKERDGCFFLFANYKSGKYPLLATQCRDPSKQISGETSRNYRDHKLNSAAKWSNSTFLESLKSMDNILTLREFMFDSDNLSRGMKMGNQWKERYPRTLVVDKLPKTFQTSFLVSLNVISLYWIGQWTIKLIIVISFISSGVRVIKHSVST